MEAISKLVEAEMGLTKRIFIERDPAYEEVRRRYAEDFERHRKEFPFRIGTRRRNRKATKPYWDATWRIVLQRAVKQLGLEVLWVNDRIFLRTSIDLELLKARAELLHSNFHARLKGRV